MRENACMFVAPLQQMSLLPPMKVGEWFSSRSFTFLTKEISVPLFSALVRPHLENSIQANCLHVKKNLTRLVRKQQAATRWVKVLRCLNYEEWLKALKLLERFGPDSQDRLPNWPGCLSTVRVLQKARTMKVITKSSSTTRESPKKKESVHTDVLSTGPVR